MNADPLEHARALEVLGEHYYRQSDIGVAKRNWDAALLLRQQAFGDSTVEASVGYAYRARYNSYMAAAQLDQQTLALDIASRAKRLLGIGKGIIEPHERTLILREYGYAFKVANIFKGNDDHEQLSRSRGYYREALHVAISAKDTIWIAQVTHDIGNTFTDEIGRYASELPANDLHNLVDSGLAHYRRSVELMTDAGFGTSEAVMMDHYTTALLYRGAYQGDSIPKAIEYFDKALRTLLRHAGNVADVEPLTYDPRVSNPAQMVELLYQRAAHQQRWIHPRTALEQLDHAIGSITAAVPYWEQILREYKSSDLEKVTGTYSHFPFRIGSELFMQRYRLTGDRKDLLRSFTWSERNRSALAQRKRLRAGRSPNTLDDTTEDPSALRAPVGTVIIAYDHPENRYAFVLDENGLSVAELGKVAADPDHSSGQFNEFLAGKQDWTPLHYAEEAYQWYHRLLEPILKEHQQQHIIIVPYGSLALLPFEALCKSPSAEAWNDVAFIGHTHTIRYARSVAEALTPAATCVRSGATFATADADNLSDLPFAKRLTDRLHASFSGSMLDREITRAGLVNAFPSPGLLHIALHGINPAMPDETPYLQLADGPFSIAELYEARIDRTLAVLSTCSSGSGRNFQGEGIMSIAHGFLSAGTKATVHALWPVDDRATSEILQWFYAGLEDGLPASLALQKAKADYLTRHAHDGLAHPFYWSGIVLSGTDVVLELEPKRTWRLAIGTGLLLLAGGYLFFKRIKRSRALPDT